MWQKVIFTHSFPQTQYRHHNQKDSKRCGHTSGEKDNIKIILYAFSWDIIEIAFWKSLWPSMKHFSFRGMSIFPAVILVWWLPPFLILFFFIQTCVWTGLLYMDGMHSNNFLNVDTIHPRFPTEVVTMAILRVFLWTHYLIEIIFKKAVHLRYLPAPNLNHLTHLQNQPITDVDTARLKSTAFWLQNMRAEPGLKFNFHDCATGSQQSNNWNMIKALKSYFCISFYWVTGLKSSKSHSQSNTLLESHTQWPQ